MVKETRIADTMNGILNLGNHFLVSICILIIVCKTESSVSTEFKSAFFTKLAKDETIQRNESNWLTVQSRLYCSAICLSTKPCIGFQYGALNDNGVIRRQCDLISDNSTLHPRVYSPGFFIYGSEIIAEDMLPDSQEIATTQYTTEVPISEIPSTSTTAQMPPPGPCVVDAAFTTLFNIVVFSGSWVYFYNNSIKLLVGPYQSMPVSSYIPGWTGSVNAVYTDAALTNIYMITESEVKTYQLSDLSYQSTETYSQHFTGFSPIPTNIDGIVIYNNDLLIIDDDFVQNSSQTVQLSVKDSLNPFDAVVTTTSPPTGVTSITLTRTFTPLFFVGSQIFHYTPDVLGAKGMWDYFGPLVC